MLAQLRRNLALLYAAELGGKILGLVVFGYLGRVLLTARYGDLEFALGILFLLNLVIDAGLGHYGAREVAKNPEITDRLVGQIAIVRTGLIAVSFLLLGSIALAIPRDPIARIVIVLQGVVLLPTPFILTWVFQARDEMWVVATANLLRQVLLAAGVLAFVSKPADVWMVPLWDGVGLGAAVTVQVFLFRRSGGSINPLRFLEGTRKVIVESAPLAASSVVWAVRLFSPLLALGIFRTSVEVGVFGAGHRLVIAAHTFVWLYFFNILPSLSRLGIEPGLERLRDFFQTSMRLVGWVAFLGASMGTVLAPVLIPVIYGDNLTAAAEPFAVMAWMLAIAFVSGHHRFTLIALSMQREEFWASLAGAATAVLACAALGSTLTPMAAAWIFVLAEAVTLVFAAVYLKRGAPGLASFGGVARPAIFTVLGLGAIGLWLPGSPLLAAGLMIAAYLTALFSLEHEGLRELLRVRGS